MQLANQHPYYKYNGMWTRQMETYCFCTVFLGWLGLDVQDGKLVHGQEGKLFTYEEVAQRMGGKTLPFSIQLKPVPTDEDDSKFHLSIEEYLHSLITLINELVASHATFYSFLSSLDLRLIL
jgi:hypothetical protein